MHLYTPPAPARSIPLVDLQGTSDRRDTAARDVAAQAIQRACRETGFFYVSHHGVDARLIERQFLFARRFFDLPLAEKNRLLLTKNAASVGYVPIGGQRLDSQDVDAQVAPPDLKESFFWGADVPDDHPYRRAEYRAYGTNIEPPVEGFRSQMETYAAEMRRVGDLLLSLIARSLDLDDGWFAGFFQSDSCNLRMLKYPPQLATAEFNQLGAGAHSDWGALTLLAQDDIGGLEVRNVAGEWIAAPPIPGTLVINIGDQMARWTNGLYTSNLHRVLNNQTYRDRYSIPFFYNPDPPAVIEAIPTCVSADNPRRFATCTSNEHMDDMFERSYGFRPGSIKVA